LLKCTKSYNARAQRSYCLLVILFSDVPLPSRFSKLPTVVKHPRKGTNESAKESSHEAKITMNWTFAVYICSQEIHS